MKALALPLLLLTFTTHAGNPAAVKTCDIYYEFSSLIYTAKQNGRSLNEITPVLTQYTEGDADLRARLLALTQNIFASDIAPAAFAANAQQAHEDCVRPFK